MVSTSDAGQTLETWKRSANVRYPANSPVFQQGDVVRAVWYLADGMVKSLSHEADEDIITSLSFAGSLLGAAAAISGCHHGLTTVTVVPSELRVISLADFHQANQNDRGFALAVQRSLALETLEASRIVGRLAGQRPRKRLEALLRYLSVALPRARDGAVYLPLRVQELGQMVGLSREHTSRMLGVLLRDGIVRRIHGRLMLQNGGR